MPQPLDARIASAMGDGARLATVNELVAEVAAAIADAQAEHDKLDVLSKDAAVAEEAAEQAADDAAKLARRIVRLGAKKEQLTRRAGELENSERRKRAEAEYAQALAARDQLVTDLKEHWPRIAGEIVTLLDRLEASDAECDRSNRVLYGREWLLSAEAVARACPGNFPGIIRLKDMKVPALSANTLAWPKPVIRFDHGEAHRQQRIQYERERADEAARWSRFFVEPPKGNQDVIPLKVRGGTTTVRRDQVVLVLSVEGVAEARAKGCTVTPAKDNESIGSPAAVAFI